MANLTAFIEYVKAEARSLLGRWKGVMAASGAAAVIAAAALIFDTMTPQMVAVGIFYVAIVLTGFWFPWPKALLVLALVATFLIIVGYWLAIPDSAPRWAAWTNRVSAIGTVWLIAIFVWYIRILEQKLQTQIDIANNLSREMSHRVGNSLQLVSSFLRLQAANASSDGTRKVLDMAGSRVMVIGRIQRTLSHASASGVVNSDEFVESLIGDVCSTLPDPDKISIRVKCDRAELTSTTAIAVGALLVELINNALKHAFGQGMKGTLAIKFTSDSAGQYELEVEDDGVGMGQMEASAGFGTRTVTELAHLLQGSITCQAARESNRRPGTKWRLVFPHGVLN